MSETVNNKLNDLVKAENNQSDMRKVSLEDAERIAYIDSYKQDTKERKHYADKTFKFLCSYMFAVFLLLIFVGSDHIDFHFSDAVVIALITTTTANVIGIFIFVMRYLFNGSKKK